MVRVHRLAATFCLFWLGACGSSPPPPAARPAAASSQVAGALPLAVSPDATLDAVMRSLVDAGKRSGLATCPSTVLVWGEVLGAEQAQGVALTLTGEGRPVLSGRLVCEADLPDVLSAQKKSPRLVGLRSGGADLRWQGGQFLLRRSWTGTSEAMLGDLAERPDALQKGELLAVAFDATPASGDTSATAGRVLPALGRVPLYFLLGMWTLTPR